MANELKVGSAGVSDAELLRGAGRDPDAFRDFYERYSEEILGYFRRRTGDRDTALELTAETFSRAWVTRERFEDRHEGSAAPWLFGIARNVLLMSIRRGAVERRTATRLGVLERLDLDGSSDAVPEEDGPTVPTNCSIRCRSPSRRHCGCGSSTN